METKKEKKELVSIKVSKETHKKLKQIQYQESEKIDFKKKISFDLIIEQKLSEKK